MLMRWCTVDENGRFNAPPSAALAYGATLLERIGSVQGSATAVESAVLTALRYSVVRTQGPTNPQLIHFQTQQLRLFPLIAGCYAAHFTGQRALGALYFMDKKLEQGDNDYYLKVLPDMHALGCGLKALLTWWAADGLETCRRAIGGLAYLSLSGIPALIGDFGVATTGGGDNVVIAQQTARYLLKISQKIQQSNSPTTNVSLGESVSYLMRFSQLVTQKHKLKANQLSDMLGLSLDDHLFAFSYLSTSILFRLNTVIQNEVMSGKAFEAAWNDHLCELVDLTLVHSFVYVLESSSLAIQSAPANLKPILLTLIQLFSFTHMEKFISLFLEAGYLGSQHVALLRQVIIELCGVVRQDCVSLTDAFHVPDFVLNTPIGRYDGNTYPHFLKAVQEARDSQKVVPFWPSVLAPVYGQSKL
eukprot:TRINITY_DN3471_c0_g1_i1.p1 TRINITY_DN3471_c0_g1~~TRINITY_DN3471_c0_g1_i1.p1  ORF type:complete len:417 (+),score=118.91 TRINITY_DN3471_c0_g1_i1:839-2089(+)